MRLFINLFIVLVLVCKPAAPWLDYALNRDKIAQTLCVNKDKPQLHCNGKCYLGKSLADDVDSKPITKNKSQVIKLLDSFIPVEPEILAVHFYIIIVKLNVQMSSGYRFCLINLVWRPPIFS